MRAVFPCNHFGHATRTMFSAFLIATAPHAFPQDLLPDNIQYSGVTLDIKKYAQFPGFSQNLISMTSCPGDDDYGLLYIAHGDASDQSATFGGGENLDDGLGKVFRVDPVQRGFSKYATPRNPFVDNSGA